MNVPSIQTGVVSSFLGLVVYFGFTAIPTIPGEHVVDPPPTVSRQTDGRDRPLRVIPGRLAARISE
jgi:hypothetical protein